MIKIKSYLATLVVFSIICFKLSANAEHICRTEVQYKWRTEKSAAADVPPDPKAHKPTEAPAAAPNNELTVFWALIEQKGKNEEDAKQNATKQSLSERGAAEKACLNAHENLSGCVAAKYLSLSPSVSTLGFSAKKSVDDAIKEDCAKQQGKCTGSSITEIKCSEIIPDVKPTEVPTGKDSKAKKK